MEQRKKRRSSKMQIEELRVQSFVTELKPEVALTAKGGEEESTTWCQLSGALTVASIQASKESKWPCKFACNSGGGSSGGGSGGGGSPQPTEAGYGSC